MYDTATCYVDKKLKQSLKMNLQKPFLHYTDLEDITATELHPKLCSSN
jgi:hypothetical protein